MLLSSFFVALRACSRACFLSFGRVSCNVNALSCGPQATVQTCMQREGGERKQQRAQGNAMQGNTCKKLPHLTPTTATHDGVEQERDRAP